MNKKEARELMKDNFDEISCHKWMVSSGEGIVRMDLGDNVNLYFKPKENFPKVFVGFQRTFKVYYDGDISIADDGENEIFIYGALPALYKAVELSKKLREKED